MLLTSLRARPGAGRPVCRRTIAWRRHAGPRRRCRADWLRRQWTRTTHWRLTRRQRSRPLRRTCGGSTRCRLSRARGSRPAQVPGGSLRCLRRRHGGSHQNRPSWRCRRCLTCTGILDAQSQCWGHDAAGRRRHHRARSRRSWRRRRRACHRRGSRRPRCAGFGRPGSDRRFFGFAFRLDFRRGRFGRCRCGHFDLDLLHRLGPGLDRGRWSVRNWRRYQHGLRRRRRLDGSVISHHGHRRSGGSRHGGLCALDQSRRRQRRRGGPGGLRRFRRLASFLCGRRIGKRSVRRHIDVALSREALDELPRDDFFDRARRALDLDPVIALEQRDHFLARGIEQLRYPVNPDCRHSAPFLLIAFRLGFLFTRAGHGRRRFRAFLDRLVCGLGRSRFGLDFR